MDNTTFTCDGRTITCSGKARFLLEVANGTSSYTLVRGFNNPDEAIKVYSEMSLPPGKRKRLTMFDAAKRTLLARSG